MRTESTEQDFAFCLIGGSGRSGTSILRTIFAGHPQLSDVPEWRFAIDPDGLVDFHTSLAHGWSPYLYDLRLKRLESLLRALAHDPPLRIVQSVIQRLRLHRSLHFNMQPRYIGLRAVDYCPKYVDLVGALLEELTAFRYQGSWTGMVAGQLAYAPPPEPKRLARVLGDFWRSVARCVLEHQGASHYLEKSTWNILWIDKVMDLLPEARLVHIYRDPRDVVASYVKQRWTPSDPVLAARMYQDIMECWALKGPPV